MQLRISDLRFFFLAGLAVAGCECGSENLIDARAKLSATPLALDFGNVVKGDLRVLGVELSNTGAVALNITSHVLTSTSTELAFASPPPDAIGPQQKITVSVAYQPSDLGLDTGTITFAANDGMDPIVITLRGVGVESGAGVTTDGEPCDGTAGSISFGRVSPGMTAERHVTVKSQGGSPLQVLGAAVEPGTSGEFSIDASALPKTLASGEELVLTVRYMPSDGGPDSGAFVITTDAPSSPSIRVPVCAVGAAPALCGRPVPLDLGVAGEGQSVTGHLTLESCGTEPVTLTAVALANDANHMTAAGFRLTSTPTVPQTLAPGHTVDVEVTYDGAQPYGPKNGFVQASSSARGAPESYFPITARTATPCALLVSPSDLYFREVAVGTNSRKSALVASASDSPCTVSMLSVTSTAGGSIFALTSPPATPFTLGAGESRVIDVTFTPVDMNPIDGTLTVTDAGGGTQTVGLHGNPPEMDGCAFEVMPAQVTFGLTAVGTMVHQGVRVIATGGNPCRVTAARLLRGDPQLTVTVPALRTAFPGVGGVNIDLVYAPTASSGVSDILQIDVGALGTGTGGGSALVGISGGAADAQICVTPPALDFGTVAPGGTATQSLTITSCGAVAVNLRGAILSAGQNSPFRITTPPTIPQSIAPGMTATPSLMVTYAPQDAGPHFGQVEILSTDRMNPSLRVPLTGNFAGGCDRVLQCTPSPLSFGDTFTGGTSVIRVVCRSLGNAAVTVSQATLAGGGPELRVSGAQLPATVQPGDAWTFDVVYSPSTLTSVSATLDVTSNACLGPSAIPVAGTGIEQPLPPCQPPSTFSPRTQWQWTGSQVMPTFTNVWSTPLVANLDDDNNDGRVDQNDIPEVIFLSIDNYNLGDPGAANPAVLRVVRGDTGVEEFSVTDPRFVDSSILALGDLDGDGLPEIVGCKWTQTPPGMGTGGFFGRFVTGTLVALDHTGHLLWESDPWSWPQSIIENASAISVADLDGDGFGEVIMGRDVWDHNGHIKWRGTAGYGQVSDGIHSIVADIDLDGRPEVLAGGTVYNYDGSIKWQVQGIDEGGTAVGMLDLTDPYPEVALHDGTTLHVYDHLGTEKWHATVGSMAPATMLPILADFDGDGDVDVAVADGMSVQVLHGTGGLMWSAPSSDSTCCVGISAFDFEGDGAYELILNDYGTVYVYRGDTGQQLYSAARPSVTAFEMPVVADIDNDGKGELVVANFGAGQGGIVAYSNVGDTWVAAPRIWNQQAFHVTNIYENGTLPRSEPPISNGPKVFRGTAPACR